MIEVEALEFFNSLSGKLHIELSEPARPVAPNLLNLVAPPGACVLRVALTLEVYEEEDFRPLTDEEWSRVVLRAPSIRMASVDTPEIVIETPAPNGEVFTVRHLQGAIARTEQLSRESGDWMGGVDVHHVYFEGMDLEDGVWVVSWGS